MKKILLIEDNREISKNIREYLEIEDFEVTQAFDGEVGIEKATKQDFDLILLDLMLPEVDGISIARRVREKKGTPIIITSARETLQDRLQGFDVGAVDYMVKPFNLSELLARMKVHISDTGVKKEYKTANGITKIGDIEVDLKKHTFTKDSANIHLTQKEFLIVEKLISESDRVVSRADIIEYLWGGDNLFEGDNKLDVYISNIRSKLGKEVIKTVKGVGYIIGE